MNLFLTALLMTSITMSAVILLLWLVSKLLSHKVSAVCRYYLWLVVLVGLLIPIRPNIPIPFEPVQIPVLFATTDMSATDNENIRREQSLTSEKTPQFPQSASMAETEDGYTIESEAGNGFVLDAPVPGSLIEKQAIPYSLVLFGIWIAGTLCILLFHLRIYGKFVSAVHRWSAATGDECILSVMRETQDDMRIKRGKVMVKTCALVSSPMLVGFCRPTILLPETPIPSDELAYILKHELTHYKRRDLWINLLVLLVSAVYWFNPFVYLMGKIIRVDCEVSCDEMVVAGSGADSRRRYGETVIGFVGTQSTGSHILSTYFYGGGSNMKKRLFSIMDTGRKSRLLAMACVAVVILTTILPVSAFAASPGIGQYIGETKAKSIALSDAGLSESQVVMTKSEFGGKNDIRKYKFDFTYSTTKYKYEVDALSGTILKSEQKAPKEGRKISSGTGTYISKTTAEQKALDLVESGSVVLSETKDKKDGRVEYKITVVSGDISYKIELYGDGTLKKMKQENITSSNLAADYAGNTIGDAKAKEIALKKSGGGTVTKCKLDNKKEGCRYEVKIINIGVEHKVKIYAETGVVYEYSFKSK